MQRTAAATTWAVAVTLLATVTAGCSDDSGGEPSPSQSGQTRTASPSSPPKGPATVAVKSTELGKVLVDAEGRTLYLFEADTSAKSTCDGDCATAWPPLTTEGKPKAGKGVEAGKLGTGARSDGTRGVTYNGHPLYRYEKDEKPGDTKGQDVDEFGAEWYVLGPDGKKVEGGGGDSGGSSGGSGGY